MALHGSRGGGAAGASFMFPVSSESFIKPPVCSSFACTLCPGSCLFAGGLTLLSQAALQLGSPVLVRAIVMSRVVILSNGFDSGMPLKVQDCG